MSCTKLTDVADRPTPAPVCRFERSAAFNLFSTLVLFSLGALYGQGCYNRDRINEVLREVKEVRTEINTEKIDGLEQRQGD